MQADSSVGVRTGCSVFEVSLDGTSNVGKLAADLMMAPGEQFNFYQMVPVRVP